MTVHQITKRNDVRVVTTPSRTVTVASGLRQGIMLYVGPTPPEDTNLIWVDTSYLTP